MNISELADELNLSVTTVSRALSGQGEKYRVSKATVQRVLDAAEKHHVAPDPLGAGLQRGKLGMVGLLVPDITNSFFSGLARSIELVLRKRGMTVQLCDTAEDEHCEVEVLEHILKRRLDGLILAPVGKSSERLLRALESAPFPVVIVDRIFPEITLPTVSLDNEAAGRLAAGHLLAHGHRRIACLRGDRESHTDRARFRGVQAAMQQAGLQLDPALVQGAGYTRAAGVEGAQNILSQPHRPDAVISLNGQGILGILEVAAEKNLQIPADLSVVAFDEQPWSALVKPPLTTIEQPVELIAKKAAELICEKISGTKPKQRHIVLQAVLRERKSVA
ncbi:MAG: LacI family DNA-binding transcriptional regulator [Verrucomicrobiales bacterium]|nr:LacI family DNA-binding transcriptional regulator [Verrucomicrobiales bacterium]